MQVLRRWNDSGRCTGCRSCELACSYHSTGTFQPSAASILVERDDLEGEIALTLLSSCDRCVGERDPWCIAYCPRDVLDRFTLGFTDPGEGDSRVSEAQ